MQTGSRDLEVQARNQALQLERIEQQMARLRVVHENSIEESRALTAELRSFRRSTAGHRHNRRASCWLLRRDDRLPGGPSLEPGAGFPQLLMCIKLISTIRMSICWRGQFVPYPRSLSVASCSYPGLGYAIVRCSPLLGRARSPLRSRSRPLESKEKLTTSFVSVCGVTLYGMVCLLH